MISTIIKPGDKVEITPIGNLEKKTENTKNKHYFSKIYDIIDEDKLKITMPTEGTKIIVMTLNMKYEICVITANGLYKCKGRLIERYKDGTVYVAILELYTGLQKYQRRQHYRLECNLELQYRILTEKEVELFKNSKVPSIFHNKLIENGRIKGITLDISGGGIRFVSSYPSEIQQKLLLEFEVTIASIKKEFQVLSQVIQSRVVPNRENTYEHRVQFENIDSQDREYLIKFIFEEERRHRKNEKG